MVVLNQRYGRYSGKKVSDSCDNLFIGGGKSNVINQFSHCSFIGGGQLNTIGETSPGTGLGSIFGVIGGGCCNNIDGSNSGAATTYGVIGGGQANCICAGTNHSSIFSGNGNMVSGSCSSILGGSGNSDGGNSNVFILGSSITAVLPDTTHINGLWANGIPSLPGGIGTVPKQVYWDCVGNLNPSCCILFIA